MPKYLLSVSYTLPGIQGVQKEGGTARKNAAEKLIQSLGGTIESFYFAFGDDDVYLIADMPSNEAVAAASIRVAAAGGVVSKTTVLLTPEEIDRATHETSDYTPPGG